MRKPSIDIDAFELFGITSSASTAGSPERQLLMAILERAVLDFVGNNVKEIEEAREWIFAELEETALDEFSFAWVCQQLGIDPVQIARKVEAMPTRGQNRIAPWYFATNYWEEA